MGSARGLKTRLCPKCKEFTPHRTLYAKTESGGSTRWFQLFWMCTRCVSLNHVIYPAYRLERASSPLPSTLAIAVVNALGEEALDFGDLVARLRQGEVSGVRHIFNSEVTLVLDFLKGHGAVREEQSDRTERNLEALRATSGESTHLGPCPDEQRNGVVTKAQTSLYMQTRRRAVPVGVLCLSCGYHTSESDLIDRFRNIDGPSPQARRDLRLN